MRAVLALLPFTVFALASCDTKTSSAPGDLGNMTTSNGPPPTCQPTCSAAADCGTPGDPLYDPSHFACQAGRCQWLGCKAASECSSEAHGGTFLCKMATGATVPSCIPSCQSPADCVPPGNTNVLDNAGHFACNSGVCQWLGCASTAECSTALKTSKISCETPTGAPARTCVPTCTTTSDCAGTNGGGALDDASHYTCSAGRCQWHGCKSTAECKQVSGSSNFICE